MMSLTTLLMIATAAAQNLHQRELYREMLRIQTRVYYDHSSIQPVKFILFAPFQTAGYCNVDHQGRKSRQVSRIQHAAAHCYRRHFQSISVTHVFQEKKYIFRMVHIAQGNGCDPFARNERFCPIYLQPFLKVVTYGFVPAEGLLPLSQCKGM
jgi:hypothetical protein